MGEFSVHRKDVNEISVLNIEGYLDSHTAPFLENEIEQLVSENRYASLGEHMFHGSFTI